MYYKREKKCIFGEGGGNDFKTKFTPLDLLYARCEKYFLIIYFVKDSGDIQHLRVHSDTQHTGQTFRVTKCQNKVKFYFMILRRNVYRN